MLLRAKVRNDSGPLFLLGALCLAYVGVASSGVWGEHSGAAPPNDDQRRSVVVEDNNTMVMAGMTVMMMQGQKQGKQ